MRTKYANRQQRLGQFFTPDPIADLLASFLDVATTSILELGCGVGSLGASVLRHCPEVRYAGVELDRRCHKQAADQLPAQSVFLGNAVSASMKSKLRPLAPFNASIGNPPYIQCTIDSQTLDLIYRIFPSLVEMPLQRLSRLDLAFLSISLSLVENGGKLAFILPKTFFSEPGFSPFRQDLLQRYQCDLVAELDPATFEGIEVDTVILVLRNQKPTAVDVRLGRVSLDGELIAELTVPHGCAINRMDYSHYSLMQQLELTDKAATRRLADVVRSFQRGTLSRVELSRMGRKYFHTTDFPSELDEVDFGEEYDSIGVHARAGDILVPRVGSRCLLKQVIVQGGERAITDCVYRIDALEGCAEIVLQSFQHEIGQRWRQAHARGTCAKYLTVSDLMQMPLCT